MLAPRKELQTGEEWIKKNIEEPTAAKREKKKLNRRTGRNFFEAYEVAIRHHQAVHGSEPIFERFWHFWGNHFTIISKAKLAIFNTGVMQRETIRPHMAGYFADLLYSATVSWPMIKSLDNFKSIGPNSEFNKKQRLQKKRIRGLNENHARELLELHTVSPFADYNQSDVLNTAAIMTGWGFARQLGEKTSSELNVAFNPRFHEPGQHKVLGKLVDADTQNGGFGQLRELTDALASSEHCIRFVSEKLCRHFICDKPTDEMVSFVVQAWRKADGFLPSVHSAVIDATWRWGGSHQKFIAPETWLLQSARITGADWPGDPTSYQFKSKITKQQRHPLIVLGELGHRPYRSRQPDGLTPRMNGYPQSL